MHVFQGLTAHSLLICYSSIWCWNSSYTSTCFPLVLQRSQRPCRTLVQYYQLILGGAADPFWYFLASSEGVILASLCIMAEMDGMLNLGFGTVTEIWNSSRSESMPAWNSIMIIIILIWTVIPFKSQLLIVRSLVALDSFSEDLRIHFCPDVQEIVLLDTWVSTSPSVIYLAYLWTAYHFSAFAAGSGMCSSPKVAQGPGCPSAQNIGPWSKRDDLLGCLRVTDTLSAAPVSCRASSAVLFWLSSCWSPDYYLSSDPCAPAAAARTTLFWISTQSWPIQASFSPDFQGASGSASIVAWERRCYFHCRLLPAARLSNSKTAILWVWVSYTPSSLYPMIEVATFDIVISEWPYSSAEMSAAIHCFLSFLSEL